MQAFQSIITLLKEHPELGGGLLTMVTDDTDKHLQGRLPHLSQLCYLLWHHLLQTSRLLETHPMILIVAREVQQLIFQPTILFHHRVHFLTVLYFSHVNTSVQQLLLKTLLLQKLIIASIITQTLSRIICYHHP